MEKIQALREDVDDILIKIEKSFNIRFYKEELINVKTFGELIEIIINKIELEEENNSCTTQQAFYKLKKGILTIKDFDKQDISPTSKIKLVFPKNTRRKEFKKLEEILELNLNCLKPHGLWIFVFLVLSLISIVIIFKFPLIGFFGILFSFAFYKIINIFGNTLELETIGELAEKISNENYFKVRRNANTFNRNEIKQKVENLFFENLILEQKEISLDAEFDLK